MSSVAQLPAIANHGGAPRLRRNAVGLTGAVVMSAAIMGPGVSTFFNPQFSTPFSGEATPFVYRDAQFAEVIIGVDPDPANAAMIRDWTVSYWDATHPFSAGGAYVNFMMDEGTDRVRASYGPNYDRLARIKAAYDPDNFFRINQNIPPAAS